MPKDGGAQNRKPECRGSERAAPATNETQGNRSRSPRPAADGENSDRLGKGAEGTRVRGQKPARTTSPPTRRVEKAGGIPPTPCSPRQSRRSRYHDEGDL